MKDYKVAVAAYKYIGKSRVRVDEQGKLSGKSLFAADIHLPGMLCGKILRSPYAHAHIVNIDISQAQRLPGVKAVVTTKDTPGVRIGRWIHDRPILALDEVNFVGEPVAAVAAIDEETAEEALELIRVEYQELPAIFDPVLAMKPGAPLVHKEADAFEPRPPHRQPKGNMLHEAIVRSGDVDKGLAESYLVHQDSYHTPVVHQGFIEAHAAVAVVDHQGKATVWSSTKSPFQVRSMTAEALQWPLSRIRVIAPGIGGDFGGKGSAYLEPVAILLSLKSGCPVRLVLDQQEELSCTFRREAAFIELTLGVKKDGTFHALRGQIIFDSGAYCDLLGMIEAAAMNLAGPYRIHNVELKACRVYTNNSPTGQMRAPSAPHPTFAIESQIDMVSRQLGIDPIEIRLKNAVVDGYSLPGGKGTLRGIGFKPTLLAAADYLKRRGTLKEKNRGCGVACGQWAVRAVPPGGLASSAWVKLNEDGTVVLITGVTEQGGGQYGILAQIVAESLNISPEAVSVVAADTETTPYEGGTGASQTTYRVGTSVRLAAEDARQKLMALAAEKLGAPIEDLEIGQGKIQVKGARKRSIDLASLASASLTSGNGPIIGVGQKLRQEYIAAQAAAKGEIDSATYSTHIAQVEVDPDTGQVKVLNYFAAHDVGFALHPDNVRGQIEGGIVFGLGYALSEELVSQKGKTLNPSLLDYKLPIFADVPPIESVLIEVPSRFGPYGAKGVGEPPLIPVAPAIANAIYDAVGVRLRELPMTPERVSSLLRSRVRKC